jgi:glycosyltransferase involved in cell wall biosynthesis
MVLIAQHNRLCNNQSGDLLTGIAMRYNTGEGTNMMPTKRGCAAMRIAIVTENFLPKLDGVTRTIAMLLEHLQTRGHQAIVFGPEDAPRHYAGARVIGVPGPPIPFYPELRMLFPNRQMGRRLANFHPDIVHLADPMLLGMVGLYWAHQLAVPAVAAYHTNIADYMDHFHLGVLKRPIWRYRRFLHNQCAATLAPSPSTIAILTKRKFERVHLWPRGVDSVLFAPDKRDLAWRRSLGIADDVTLLLYVGRLSHEKNLHVLSAAYRAVARPGVHLMLVGDGPAHDEIQAALAGLPVTFTGYLRDEKLARAYASADLFAFPSTTETFGQVVQEAMASGLPVVGCQAEGVGDLVQPGVTGLLAAPNDATAFAEALRTLLDHPDRRNDMGHAARAWAEARSWDDVMDDLMALYAEIARAPSHPLDPELDPDDLEGTAISA